MRGGPLDYPRLRAIDKALDADDIALAQRELAAVGPDPQHAEAIAYLSTRILFQLGRMSRAQAAGRLREVLRDVDFFPEAARWLRAADERPESTRPPRHSAPPGAATAVEAQLREIVLSLDAPAADRTASNAELRPRLSNPSIPRAGRLPRISTPPDPTPSYAPDRDEDGESRAGSYSEHPPRVEIIDPHKRTSAPPPASAPATPIPVTQPERDGRIRSGPPLARPARALPTSLFEIAELADSGQLEAALNALEALPGSLGAEHSLLYARLLQRGMRPSEALAVLERMESAPLLEPEVRAAVSRQLLDLNQPARARAQAEQAFADDDGSSGARAALCAVLTRSALFEGGSDLQRARALVAGAHGTGPGAAALMAARALASACAADSRAAVEDALRALHLDPHSTGALAALALSSAQLFRVHDAQQAWLRLERTDSAFAETLAPKIAGFGIALNGLSSASPGHSLPAGATPWEPTELLLADAERTAAIENLEHLAGDTLAHVAHRGGGELMVLGTVGAAFMTRAPVFRDFAPYDLSLASLARIDRALATLYGAKRPKDVESDHYSLLLLAGSYLGETLRQCGKLSWRGSLTAPHEARVLGAGMEWHPFQLVELRMKRGAPLPDAHDLGFSTTLSNAWQKCMRSPEVPPAPWDPDPWPTLALLQRLGRAMSRSVVARYCADYADGPLDRTIASLSAVDSYLALIAPPAAPALDPSVSRRLAVLLGSYVGETMHASIGGQWQDSGEAGADAFEILLSPTAATRPVKAVLSRLDGERITMSEYVSRMLQKHA